MKLKDTTYDFLKWFALVALPATNILILTVGKIWGLPYYAEIGATVAAIGLFIAALIGVSTKQYNDFIKLQNAEEPTDSFIDEEVGEIDEE